MNPDISRGAHGRGRHERGYRGEGPDGRGAPPGGRGPHGHDPDRGGHGHDGPWRGRHERMERGILRGVLLDALRDGPKHGYDLIKVIEERTHGGYAPSPGSLYPTLQYLEDLSLIRIRNEGDRKTCEITEAGRLALVEQADRVAAFWARFDAPVTAEPLHHERRFLEEEMENLTATVWRGLRGAFETGDRDTVRSVRRAVEQCREAVRALIVDGPGTGTEESHGP